MSSFTRQPNPSIDAFQFQVQSDNESSTASISTDDSDTETEQTEALMPNGPQFNGVDYLINSLYNSLDSVQLDRSLVQQSQISGEMNSTTSDILRTIDELERCLKEHIAKYEKLKRQIIPEIVSNISKSARVSSRLRESMKRSYPVEYSKSMDKVVNRITNDEEDLYI